LQQVSDGHDCSPVIPAQAGIQTCFHEGAIARYVETDAAKDFLMSQHAEVCWVPAVHAEHGFAMTRE
jgi:hypothetical protein